jgi:coenzyme F420-0:L-glutamate ligase / coenzyme F420-1:gamma-L-glutamate ligase
MSARRLSLCALAGLPLIAPGDDLAGLLAGALREMQIEPRDGDILVVAQKVVSKAEGRIVDLDSIEPSSRAYTLAEEVGKDARLVEVILRESTEVVRHKKDVLIVAHRLGFVMANAGVDQSNVGLDGRCCVLLLPCAPDASAARIKARIDQEFGVDVGVVINDSFGRPWRNGVVGVALGAAGIPALWNLVGAPDLFGRPMRVTEVALADQIASAASLLMGEAAEGLPAVHIRGLEWPAACVPASSLVRPREMDMFR